MNDKQPIRKNKRAMIIVAVVLAIIATWLIISKRETTRMIEPSNSETAPADKGIPPDSLHH